MKRRDCLVNNAFPVFLYFFLVLVCCFLRGVVVFGVYDIMQLLHIICLLRVTSGLCHVFIYDESNDYTERAISRAEKAKGKEKSKWNNLNW